MNRIYVAVLVIAVGTALASCDTSGPIWQEDSPPRGEGPDDIVLSKNAAELSDEALNNLQSEPDSTGVLPTTLSFSSNEGLEDVQTGDIIIAGFSEQTPLGMVREVTNRNALSGGAVALDTRRASLTDALDRAIFDTSATLNSNTVDLVRPRSSQDQPQSLQEDLQGLGHDKAELKKSLPASNSLRKAISGFCAGTRDSICVQGSLGEFFASVAFQPTVRFDLDHTADPTRPTTLRASAVLGRRQAIGVVARASASSSKELPGAIVPNVRIGTFTVGPIPVSVFANIGIGTEVGVTGGNLQLYRKRVGDREVGIRYNGNSFQGINREGEKSESSTVTKTTPTLNGEAEIFVIFDIDFRIAELIGPTISAEPWGEFRLSASPGSPISWRIWVGLRGLAGVNSGVGIPEVDKFEVASIGTPILPPDGLGELPANVGGDFPPLLEPPSSLKGASTGLKRKITWDPPAGSADLRYHVFRSKEDFDADDVQGKYIIIGGDRRYDPPRNDGNPNNPNYSASGITRVTGGSPINDTSFVDFVGIDDLRDDDLVYRVTAIPENSTGPAEGSGSRGSKSILLDDGFRELSGVSGASMNKQVRLNWDRPEGEELLDGYVVYRDTEPFSRAATETGDTGTEENPGEFLLRHIGDRDSRPQGPPVTDSMEAQNGTTYYYRVAPVLNVPADELEEGRASEIVKATPLPDPPNPPN